MSTIFRWSVWKCDCDAIQQLNQSIGTFAYYFGTACRYVVFTDTPSYVRERLLVSAEVYGFEAFGPTAYLTGDNWQKWAPSARIDVRSVEFKVDRDMFLVGDPVELREFSSSANGKHQFAVTLENCNDTCYFGAFRSKLPQGFAPINAGLVGQYKGADISDTFNDSYQWLRTNGNCKGPSYYDETGAIAKSLEIPLGNNEVMLLPPARYRVVTDTDAQSLPDLGDIVLLHATHPKHLGFHRFSAEISRISGIPIGET